MNKNNLFLCFIRQIGENIENEFIYELLFTETIDSFWGDDFDVFPSCLCSDLIPYENEYSLITEIKTDIKLDLAINSCCFSYQDVTDGIIPCAWQSLNGLDEYPSDGRLILHFGLSYEETEEILSNKNIILNVKDNN